MAIAALQTPNFRDARRRSFDAHDWYWCVNGDANRYYSSRLSAWVTPDDAALAAWQQIGGQITNIINLDELNEVLVRSGCTAVPVDAPAAP